MKTIFSIILCTGIAFASPVLSDVIDFRIDQNHSNIGFSVPIAGGLSEVHGKFSKFKMDLKFDKVNITKSTVSVVIDASSIDTGIDGRDNHLRTKDFFDVEKYPEITFKSTRIVKRRRKLTLFGNFTMNGITKEINFPFKIAGRNSDKEKMHLVMGFFGKLKIDRTEYGVNYQHKTVPNFIGNDIRIRLNIITRAFKLMEKEPKS